MISSKNGRKIKQTNLPKASISMTQSSMALAELRRKTRPFHHRFTSCLVCPETSVARDMLLIPGSSTWRFLLLREIFCYTKHSGTIQQWLETLIQNAKKLWMSKLKPFIKTEKKDATKSRQLKNQKYVFSPFDLGITNRVFNCRRPPVPYCGPDSQRHKIYQDIFFNKIVNTCNTWIKSCCDSWIFKSLSCWP